MVNAVEVAVGKDELGVGGPLQARLLLRFTRPLLVPTCSFDMSVLSCPLTQNQQLQGKSTNNGCTYVMLNPDRVN
jgi:hypothetical protein